MFTMIRCIREITKDNLKESEDLGDLAKFYYRLSKLTVWSTN